MMRSIMMKKIFLFSTFFFSWWSCLLHAQPVSDDLPQITGCIALINARVVSAPGKVPVTSNVIIRDGLITHTGPGATIPPDAYRIAADSFYVYPAFIDAFSSIGIKEPESDRPGAASGQGSRGARPSVDEEGNPSLEDAGITPFKSVRATFDPKEKSIADWRAQGFAVAHVVPKGKMIPGKGTVVVLNGKGTDQMLWKEDISIYSQWTGAGGSYPATVIGVMAKWRELYYNASNYVKHQSAYQNATLVSRPQYNQAHEALRPLVKKEMPLYFRAPKVKDISRALEMQKELGMNMVIADAEEAWMLKDRLKSLSLPLILSLHLPEDKSQDQKGKAKGPEGPGQDGPGQDGPKTAATGEKTVAEKSADGTKETKQDSAVVKNPEIEAFEKRRAESLKAHREQAGMLAREGIAYTFGTMSAKPNDFTKTIQTMMEHGLSFDKALSALTTQAATLLGIEKYCGTIETGKMANVIVATKPLFEKESAIRYMIVEGQLYAYEAKEKKKSNTNNVDGAHTLLLGTWTYTIETPDQRREGQFVFTDSQNEITGTISSKESMAGGNNKLDDIVVDGKEASFTFDLDMDGQRMVLEFDLKIDGDTFSGSVSVGSFGSFPIHGIRISPKLN